MNKGTADITVTHTALDVVIVAMTGDTLLDFTGPADVFINANKYLAAGGSGKNYRVSIVSPTEDKIVMASSGIHINCSLSAMELKLPIDTLLIAGDNFGEVDDVKFNHFYNWLSHIDTKNVRRIGSVCVGAFVLAKAGLLDGRKATTHWEYGDLLKEQYPLVDVDTSAFYMNDGPVYTSGGVSTGIDLALAFVEEDFGREIAKKVSKRLVFHLKRTGYQTQFGTLLSEYADDNIAAKLTEWLNEHLHETLDVVTIADHLNMSPRNFARVFQKQTGISPAKYVEKLRVEAARNYLENTDVSLEWIAKKCGLGNLISMRRTFLRHLMTTPSDYRRAFRTSPKDAGSS